MGNIKWNIDKEKEYIQYMLQKQVDGFVLLSTTLDKDYLDSLVKYEIPIVMLDREIKVDKIDYIRVNDYQGGYIAGQHLIKSAYKHIIHLSGPAGLASAEGRKHGILKSIEDADFDKENYRVIQGSYTEESGIRVMKKILSDLEKMESCGIFAANDLMIMI